MFQFKIGMYSARLLVFIAFQVWIDIVHQVIISKNSNVIKGHIFYLKVSRASLSFLVRHRHLLFWPKAATYRTHVHLFNYICRHLFKIGESQRRPIFYFRITLHTYIMICIAVHNAHHIIE